MKTFYYLLILIMSTSVLMTSCKKDSDKKSNEFKFDGSTMSLDKGFIENLGQNSNNSYDFDVALVTETISLVDGDLVGTGDLIYLDLNSSNATGLVEGTYVWSEEREVFTIVDGFAALDADVVLETGQLIEFSNGSVDISIDGGQTIVEIDMITQENKTFTGYFKGVLQSF